MKTTKIIRKGLQFGLLLVFVLLAQDLLAQCAVCKVSAESSDSKLIAGLNSGILYLMGIPYLLLMGVGVMLFRKARAGSARNAE